MLQRVNELTLLENQREDSETVEDSLALPVVLKARFMTGTFTVKDLEKWCTANYELLRLKFFETSKEPQTHSVTFQVTAPSPSAISKLKVDYLKNQKEVLDLLGQLKAFELDTDLQVVAPFKDPVMRLKGFSVKLQSLTEFGLTYCVPEGELSLPSLLGLKEVKRHLESSVCRVRGVISDWISQKPVKAAGLLSNIQVELLVSAIKELLILKKQDLSCTYMRSLKVSGFHTKILERNSVDLANLCQLVEAKAEPKELIPDLSSWLGCKTVERGFDLRFSKGTRCSAAPLLSKVSKFSLEIKDLKELLIESRSDISRIVIFENQVSFLTAEEIPGTLLIWGEGARVVKLAKQGVFNDLDFEILYWGDMDVDGYSILGQFRCHLKGVKVDSMFMDMKTWEMYVNTLSCVLDEGSSNENLRVKSASKYLTEKELEVFSQLQGRRIEQEFVEATLSRNHS